MKILWNIIVRFLSTLLKLRKPKGVSNIVAENLLLRLQLINLTTKRKRSPPTSTIERILFGFFAAFINPRRLSKACISISCSTVLRLHKALVKKKYSVLFSNKNKKKPGPKGPSQELIKFIVSIKERNPSYGCEKIALLATNVLEVDINESLIRRILRKYYKPPPGSGPSWLSYVGNDIGKLWSVDFFRVESMFLQSFWVMLVMDQYTRKIVGFSINKGPMNGSNICYMFNQVICNESPPKYLSRDHDPLFNYHLWGVNLDLYGIEELKSIPFIPQSHPYIERAIGTVRQEFTNKIGFWSQSDLEKKLSSFVDYYNKYRVHSSLSGKAPNEIEGERHLETVKLNQYSWLNHCGELYQTPKAA